jgi:hypothetical protein
MELQKFNNAFRVYNQNDQLKGSCNSIMFINQGSCDILLNNSITIIVGGSWGSDGNANEIDETYYNWIFQGSGGKLVVVQKTFL